MPWNKTGNIQGPSGLAGVDVDNLSRLVCETSVCGSDGYFSSNIMSVKVSAEREGATVVLTVFEEGASASCAIFVVSVRTADYGESPLGDVKIIGWSGEAVSGCSLYFNGATTAEGEVTEFAFWLDSGVDYGKFAVYETSQIITNDAAVTIDYHNDAAWTEDGGSGSLLLAPSGLSVGNDEAVVVNGFQTVNTKDLKSCILTQSTVREGMTFETNTLFNPSSSVLTVKDDAGKTTAYHTRHRGDKYEINSTGEMSLVGTSVTANGLPVVSLKAAAPATPTSAGKKGEIAADSGFVYVCIADNTWRRAALTTW